MSTPEHGPRRRAGRAHGRSAGSPLSRARLAPAGRALLGLALLLSASASAQDFDPILYRVSGDGASWVSGSPFCPGPFVAPMELFACVAEYHERLWNKCPVLETVTVSADRRSVSMAGPTPYCIGGDGGVFGIGAARAGIAANGVSCWDPTARASDGTRCPPAVGNPIDPATGSKHRSEIDYAGDGPFALRFERFYNSLQPQRPPAPSPPLGPRWWSPFERSVLPLQAGSLSLAYLYRPNGRVVLYEAAGGGWTGPPDVPGRLESVPGGWRLTTGADEVESYDAAGRLVSIADRAGLTQRLTYGNGDGTPSPADAPACPPSPSGPVPRGRLWCVTDPFGRQLAFAYDSESRLARLAWPDGREQTYGYDAGTGMLASITHPDASVRRYVYNEPARTGGQDYRWALTGLVDENGARHATWEYRHPGRAVSTEHAGGAHRHALAYGADGTTTVSGPLGATRVYRFTEVGGLRRTTAITGVPCPSCGPKEASFDESGFLASETDWTGTLTTYVRGDSRRPDLETSRTEAAGTPVARRIDTQWDARFRLPTRVLDPGRATEIAYDDHGRPTRRTVTDLASGRSRTWTWIHTDSPIVPGAVERTVADGPRDDVADTTVDDYYPADAACPGASPLGCRGRLRRRTDALGHASEVRRYDAHGQPEEVVDANGLVTTLAYDERLRLVSRRVGSETTRYAYDPAGQLVGVGFPDGSALELGYDAAHRPVELRDNLGNRVAYTLDAAGNRTLEQVFDPAGTLRGRRSREYDALSRLVADVGGSDPLSQVTRMGYDDQGRLTSVDGPLPATPGDVTRLAYDPLGRLREVTDALSGATRYGYDGLDQLVSVADPRDNVTAFTVSALGERTREVSPDRGAMSATFDAAGRLASRTDARGRTTTFGYDGGGRLASLTFGDATPPIYFGYDNTASSPGGRGRLHYVWDARSGYTAFLWTREGRLLARVQGSAAGVTLAAAWAYDAAGRKLALRYPSGKVVGWGYDAAGRPTAVAVGQQLVLYATTHLPFGSPEVAVWGNGRARVRVHDLDGRLWAQDLDAGYRVIAYDAAGRIERVWHDASSALDQTLAHDRLDRLTAWSGLGRTRGYAYDASGNRTRLDVDGVGFPQAIAPDGNRLLASAGPPAARAFSYDAAGSVVWDGQAGLAYDARGRLVFSQRGGELHGYLVNGLGERVAKFGPRVPSGANHFVYDEAGHLLGEYGIDGAPIQEYVWWGDEPVAVLRGDAVYYVDTDHLGAPLRVRNQAGQLVWRWDAVPFAENQPDESPSGLPPFVMNLRLPGQYYDRETGLHHNSFRDYDPATGRYVESDPVGLAGGVNTYAYGDGDPVSRRDPLGLWTREAHEYFINRAYPGLSESARRAIAQGSAAADGLIYQLPAFSPMHSMLSGKMTQEEGEDARKRFVDEQLAKARGILCNPMLRARYEVYAYRAIGMALHPHMDSTSPVHTHGGGPWRTWNPTLPELPHGSPLRFFPALAMAVRFGAFVGEMMEHARAEDMDTAPLYESLTVGRMRRVYDPDTFLCGCR